MSVDISPNTCASALMLLCVLTFMSSGFCCKNRQSPPRSIVTKASKFPPWTESGAIYKVSEEPTTLCIVSILILVAREVFAGLEYKEQEDESR